MHVTADKETIDRYSFGPFTFSPSKKVLWRRDEIVAISPIALDVLAVLLEKAPEPVSREVLLERVWKDTAVEEANVTVAISNLRKTFAERSESETEYIRTLSKRGYLFVEEVEKVVETSNGASTAVESSQNNGVFFNTKLLIIPLLLGVLLVTSFSYWYVYGDGSELSSIPVNERKYGSIAILPLKSINGENAPLSLGVTDNLISRLGRLKKFAVRPLSSVDNFTESGKDALVFGRELKVDAVVVGTIQSDAGKLRITVRLLDTRDGTQIWTGQYDEKEQDVFELQDKLSVALAKSLVSELAPTDNSTLTRSETDNLDAFRAYSTGHFYLAKRTPENLKKASSYFAKATELDPNFAAAFSALAGSYLILTDSAQGGSASTVERSKIENAINKAISLDPDSYEAYAAKGLFETTYDWDITESLKSFERSIEINPNSAPTRAWKAWSLMAQGNLDEADREMQLAKSLDPSSQIIASEAGLPLLYAGKIKESEPLFREALEMDANFFQARFRMTYFFYYSGRYAEALEQAKAMRALTPDSDYFSEGVYAMCLAKTGQRAEADKIYESLETEAKKDESMSSILLASVAISLGRNERAKYWLEKAIDDRNDFVLYYGNAPEYRQLQNEQWFEDLILKVRSKSKV